jgi:hypothetical protein
LGLVGCRFTRRLEKITVEKTPGRAAQFCRRVLSRYGWRRQRFRQLSVFEIGFFQPSATLHGCIAVPFGKIAADFSV